MITLALNIREPRAILPGWSALGAGITGLGDLSVREVENPTRRVNPGARRDDPRLQGPHLVENPTRTVSPGAPLLTTTSAASS